MGHATLESIRLLAGATLAFTRRCLVGMTANVETCNGEVERSPAMATGLNAYIGYEQASKLAKESVATARRFASYAGRKKILSEDMLEKALDPWKMTQPGVRSRPLVADCVANSGKKRAEKWTSKASR